MDETKFKESLASVMKDHTKREALAQILVEYINPTHVATDFVGLLLNTRNLNPGDALLKKVRKGIKVRTLVPGAIHLKSEITLTERMNYVLDGAYVGVQANAWEIESGELGTVGDIKNEMIAKLKDYYMNKVFTALATVWSGVNTPDNYTDVGGPLDAATLRDAIDTINQITGGVKAVIGLRADLTPVTTFGAGWSDGTSVDWQVVPENIREIMATGWLGKYYGARIIALDQVYDNPDDYNAQITPGRVLVIGENVGEFITFGDVKSKEWTDMRPTPPYWNFEIFQQFGLLVDFAEGIYVLKVS